MHRCFRVPVLGVESGGVSFALLAKLLAFNPFRIVLIDTLLAQIVAAYQGKNSLTPKTVIALSATAHAAAPVSAQTSKR